MSAETSVSQRTIFNSTLTLEVHWTREETPQLDSVVLNSNRIPAVDLQEVITVLSQVLMDGKRQNMLSSGKNQCFRG